MANNRNLDLKTVEAGLFGFAVGDALGVPIEFTSREERKNNPITEMIGHGSHNVPEGSWSDDTSMTIATMDSINECYGKIDYDNIMTLYCSWVTDGNYTSTGKLFDIGKGTLDSLKMYYYKKKKATECGGIEEKNNGNGSLMRMLPITFYLYNKNLSEQESVNIINDYSSLTHGHEISKLGCKIYNDYLQRILNGESKEQAFENLKGKNYSEYYSEESINKYNRILNGSLKDLKESDISSSGYIINTLEATLWSILNTDNFEEAVIKAVNLGNDTDTIGALTGSIAGILYGRNSIPIRWLAKLRKKDYLMTICTEFTNELNGVYSDISERFIEDNIVLDRKK